MTSGRRAEPQRDSKCCLGPQTIGADWKQRALHDERPEPAHPTRLRSISSSRYPSGRSFTICKSRILGPCGCRRAMIVERCREGQLRPRAPKSLLNHHEPQLKGRSCSKKSYSRSKLSPSWSDNGSLAAALGLRDDGWVDGGLTPGIMTWLHHRKRAPMGILVGRVRPGWVRDQMGGGARSGRRRLPGVPRALLRSPRRRDTSS